MGLHSHCGCQDFIAELSFPQLLVLDHMGVSITDWEVDVEVFYLFWNLLLNASFLLLDPYNVLVGRPVSFDVFKRLLEEKGKILSFWVTHSQALDIDVTILFWKLLEEDHLHSYFVECLEETFLVVADLCEDILIESYHCLFMINWCQNKMMVISESFLFGKCKIDVVWCT